MGGHQGGRCDDEREEDDNGQGDDIDSDYFASNTIDDGFSEKDYIEYGYCMNDSLKRQ